MSIWQAMWEAAASDFGDLDAPRATRIGIRLLMAALLGGAIGFERQWKRKRAGLRTHMLVALGAALFIVVQNPTESHDAVSRAIQGVAAGIGFLGAGSIIKDARNGVKGLTTAADIWLTAAIGVAAGMGQVSTALLTTVLALIILGILPWIERRASAATPNSVPAADEPHPPKKPPDE